MLTTGENAHDAKADVEERQGIRNETPHTLHPAHGTEDARGAVRAPHDGGRGHDDAQGRVHGHDDAEQAGDGQGQQAVAQDGGAAEVGQGRGQLVGLVAVGRGRLARLVGAVGGGLRVVGAAVAVLEGRHERDDEVQRYRAQRREAVDVAEVQVAREEEEEAEQPREQDGAAQVAVVHQVLVDAAEGIEYGECLARERG